METPVWIYFVDDVEGQIAWNYSGAPSFSARRRKEDEAWFGRTKSLEY
jgi:hypothetical protein